MRHGYLWGLFGLFALVGVTLHLIVTNSTPTVITRVVVQEPHSQPQTWPSTCPEVNYSRALLKHASSPDKVIILALVDEAFADMAVNLYLTSYQPHGIKNFLFVGAGNRACELLAAKDLQCVTYMDDKDSAKASTYNSKAFKRKMNIRTFMISDALALGFSVVHTDLDMMFLKNPMPTLTSTKGDLVSLWDDFVHNAGFLLVRPTEYGKQIYKKMDELTKKTPSMDDQTALNRAVKGLKGKKGFKAVALNKNQFLCGLGYFEKGHRLFPSPCKECIVVHNNWIVSREAKIYRFKEHFMWAVDERQYYTSPSRKYIAYENPVNFGKDKTNRDNEMQALKSALAIGQALNRTVILPKFHCNKDGKQDCPLNSLLRITPFDSQFGENYREHSFLHHPLVPQLSITSSPLFISSPQANTIISENKVKIDDVEKTSAEKDVISDKDVVAWFGGLNESVLKLHSLYGLTVQFDSSTVGDAFAKKIKSGFVQGKYRQL
ncbi:hypothetical protein CAPTEDRAFT_213446 [Capitella teleta]|uniref:Nucleotide-diphospho-sugar transferase domain-containing protein n=1 Tax=Capitella teleta TaxID=283909 RepID=R7VM47_CAPTE|nr:hypothetical protein CAPTEDRAFT_213446 [Capitella teleta]|eukprot:ELU18210.1 hypothetical protein CAPTEDRAFT_213446 [Capitella teleta]